MLKQLYSYSAPRRNRYLAFAAFLLLLVVVVGLFLNPPWQVAEPSTVDLVGKSDLASSSEKAVNQPSIALDAQHEERLTDAYSERLNQLRQWANKVSRSGGATAYEGQLENLARQGREALANNRWSASSSTPMEQSQVMDANAYIGYLDALREMGAEAYAAGAGSIVPLTGAAGNPAAQHHPGHDFGAINNSSSQQACSTGNFSGDDVYDPASCQNLGSTSP